jgi:hypothetical protein
LFPNPFRPGAGQVPPHLAGRETELEYFKTKSLSQHPILQNLIVSGLRGVGKTVLLDTLKTIAIKEGWIWAGADLSESTSVSEKTLSTRIMVDIGSATSPFSITEEERTSLGFAGQKEIIEHTLNYNVLYSIYDQTPGLEADKLKKVLEFTWQVIHGKANGIVLAYDEAQNLIDHAGDKQYPLSLLLEVMQFLQRKQIPYLLVLTGLPTLFSNLIESRTYSERMFHLMLLSKLNKDQSKEAITVPIKKDNCPVSLTDSFISDIVDASGGYPYFIQYLCKEIYDSYLQQVSMGIDLPNVSLEDIMRKLDTDFYQGRWNRVTDRQRDLLIIISKLENAEEEFSIKEIEEESKKTKTPFKSSPVNLMLKSLTEAGLIYKNRHGKYSFAVPMFSYFIKRELNEEMIE